MSRRQRIRRHSGGRGSDAPQVDADMKRCESIAPTMPNRGTNICLLKLASIGASSVSFRCSTRNSGRRMRAGSAAALSVWLAPLPLARCRSFGQSL
ncbi:hypothetical protein X946_5341 [Burkholderia sp. ABCPW 111]|nr:hypothetical protein X946_5341 [Burkholderia sp. ABCPW 111]